jgi:hypothetical protein
VVVVETDLGEVIEMTLEDGRRHLFWGKDFQILSAWADEQRPIACEAPADPDPSLMNTGVSLSTTIAAEAVQRARRGSEATNASTASQ